MYRAKTICRKLLFNQQFYFKHLFVLMLVGSSIAAFAGLYGRNGANLSEFTHTKALFDKNDKNNKTALSIADTIVDLKATGITAKTVTHIYEQYNLIGTHICVPIILHSTLICEQHKTLAQKSESWQAA